MQQINYAALEKHESQRSRKKWQKHFASKKAVKYLGLRTVLAFLLILVLFILGFIVLAIIALLLKELAVVIIVGAMIWLIVATSRRNKRLKSAVIAFARDNGWEVMSQQPSFTPVAVTPSDPTTTIEYPGPAVTGELDACEFWLYHYRCSIETSSVNDNRSQTYVTTDCNVLTVELPAALPNLFLDATADGQQKQYKATFIKGMEKLSLEGDFDGYFTLYQAPDTQVDVLSIITPEFMHKLIESGAYLNVQTDGKYIHFISTYGDLLNSTPTRNLIEQSRIILAAVLFKASRYKPSDVTVPTA